MENTAFLRVKLQAKFDELCKASRSSRVLPRAIVMTAELSELAIKLHEQTKKEFDAQQAGS